MKKLRLGLILYYAIKNQSNLSYTKRPLGFSPIEFDLKSRTMDLHLRKQTRDHGFLGKNLKTLVKNHRLQWFDSHIVENHWLTYSQEPLIYIWSRIVDSHKVEVQRILFSQDSSTLYNQASLALMCRQVIAQIVCAMINVLRLWKGQCFLCFVYF